MHEENNTLKETLRKQETQINKMNDEVEGMQTKLQGLQMEADVRDAELRKAQEAAFHQMKGGNWMPLEDSAIRSEFQELERAIRGWARTYSTSNVLAPDSVSPEDIEQMNYLLDRNIWDRNNTFPVSLSNWPHQNRAPRLLVHAVISQCVFEHIFNDPFYFLKDQGIGSQKESIERMGEHLNHLYNVVQEVDKHEAHAWRSQTLRLLNTPCDRSGTKDNTENLSRMACIALAKSFLHSPLKTFMGDESDEEHKIRHRELIGIFLDAGKLARKLWTQRTFMQTVDKRNLKFFKVDSPYMVAHRLQKLDDDDHRLDGQEILAVVQPGLIAYGNEDGENYDDHRVWSKAIVLVVED